jgi:F0F1-type ATP synthase membrane subunit b/b'
MNDAVGFYEQLAVWSQVLGSVAFIAVLVYVFQRFLIPAVVASQERKNAELIEAERRRDAAKEDVLVARRELDGVEEEVKALRVRAAVDARRERERILADATAEGKRLVSTAEGELDRGRFAAREAFRVALLDKALHIARRSAAEGIDAEKDRALVSGVMNAVDHQGNGTQAVHA